MLKYLIILLLAALCDATVYHTSLQVNAAAKVPFLSIANQYAGTSSGYFEVKLVFKKPGVTGLLGLGLLGGKDIERTVCPKAFHARYKKRGFILSFELGPGVDYLQAWDYQKFFSVNAKVDWDSLNQDKSAELPVMGTKALLKRYPLSITIGTPIAPQDCAIRFPYKVTANPVWMRMMTNRWRIPFIVTATLHRTSDLGQPSADRFQASENKLTAMGRFAIAGQQGTQKQMLEMMKRLSASEIANRQHDERRALQQAQYESELKHRVDASQVEDIQNTVQ
jgi:hypothetical protein